MDVLVQKDALSRLIPDRSLGDDERALAYFRLFDEPGDEQRSLSLTVEERFYNRYFWFGVFAKRHQKINGPDAGLAQQHFQILESAPESVDWTIVEHLATAIELE